MAFNRPASPTGRSLRFRRLRDLAAPQLITALLLALTACSQEPAQTFSLPVDTAGADAQSGDVVDGAARGPGHLVTVPPSAIDFGAVPFGHEVQRTLTLTNVAGGPVTITSITLAPNDQGFSVVIPGFGDSLSGPLPLVPLSIAAGQSLHVTVRCRPTTTQIAGAAPPYALASKLRLVGPDLDDGVALKATIALPNHPLSIIRVASPEPVELGDPLNMDGLLSHAPNPPVTKYEWLVLAPAPTKLPIEYGGAHLSLTPDVPGLWRFCLYVTDSSGATAPKPHCRDVQVLLPKVAGSTALAVHLDWVPAPQPGDPTPTKPPDLDLHFAHALANGPDRDCDGKYDPWFSNPFDVFWSNKQPNWGAVSSDADDPKWSKTGAASEEIRLEDPEGKLANPQHYRVGVHYYEGHTHVHARLRVTMHGVTVYERAKLLLAPGDLWFVGRIYGPNTGTAPGASKAPLELCHAAGDPCETGMKGSWWRAEGSRCISPCYKPLSPEYWGGPYPACL